MLRHHCHTIQASQSRNTDVFCFPAALSGDPAQVSRRRLNDDTGSTLQTAAAKPLGSSCGRRDLLLSVIGVGETLAALLLPEMPEPKHAGTLSQIKGKPNVALTANMVSIGIDGGGAPVRS
jgi:hypothetical protein